MTQYQATENKQAQGKLSTQPLYLDPSYWNFMIESSYRRWGIITVLKKPLKRGLCLIFVHHWGKQLLTAEFERSYIRNAEEADKADICAPAMPEGILTLTKMEQRLPPEVKIIARNFSIFRCCRPALSEFTGCFPAWLCFSLCCWLDMLFPCESLYLQASAITFGKKFPTSLLKFIPVGWNAPLWRL